jgi:hypothetical protein
MICCLDTGPKAIGLATHGLKPPKPGAMVIQMLSLGEICRTINNIFVTVL